MTIPEAAKVFKPKARLIAFYLPQFHPIPENDLWWGPGFTEWTNVAKAKPMFRGHYQPRIPADLGFYDLRVREVRAKQAAMAKAAGIEGFCYWHYWFAGRRILERPFNEVLSEGEPDFPFCLGWANQTWSGIWHGAPNRILMEQTYPGNADNAGHFAAVLPAFRDPRYIRIGGKPLFLIYRPSELPNPQSFTDQWQSLAMRNGLKGIHFVAHLAPQDWSFDFEKAGFSAATVVAALKVSSYSLPRLLKKCMASVGSNSSSHNKIADWASAFPWMTYYIVNRLREKILGRARAIYRYQDAMNFFLDGFNARDNCYPCLVPNWDNSPRSGERALILDGSTPELFRRHVRETIPLVSKRNPDERVIFVKSWNEWAEGNYLEPDIRFGHRYLDVLREEVFERTYQGCENGPPANDGHRHAAAVV